MCRWNDFTSTTTQNVLFPSHFCQCCHRKLAASCWHPLDCGKTVWVVAMRRAEGPNSCGAAPALADFCIFGSPCTKRTLFLVGTCAGTLGRCSESGQQQFIQRLPPHAQSDHTSPPRLSLGLAMVLTMNARRFQRTHPLSGMGSSLNSSKDIAMEILILRLL